MCINIKALKERILSLSTISRYVEVFNFSFKRGSLEPIRRNDSINIDDRANYAQEYLNLLGIVSENNIVFIDKVGFKDHSQNFISGRKILGVIL